MSGSPQPPFVSNELLSLGAFFEDKAASASQLLDGDVLYAAPSLPTAARGTLRYPLCGADSATHLTSVSLH